MANQPGRTGTQRAEAGAGRHTVTAPLQRSEARLQYKHAMMMALRVSVLIMHHSHHPHHSAASHGSRPPSSPRGHWHEKAPDSASEPAWLLLSLCLALILNLSHTPTLKSPSFELAVPHKHAPFDGLWACDWPLAPLEAWLIEEYTTTSSLMTGTRHSVKGSYTDLTTC
ncbi:hypothetical protein BBK36DRAFT_165069 [Trichoderma citrinoviride]|uniref:Uncharacterized protein n=1 Tax=Trichoderma citrinoviride TaxID=58853 RepID=A0A2T4B6S2_9HYPO|nr:hypothetical protein BBK36DRAFT_165069 [Trichoderma citrinoviride]PTB65033.1 hypothetical protein BBK36DRAFT_165069 [Trichoderma citrinoviride]